MTRRHPNVAHLTEVPWQRSPGPPAGFRIESQVIGPAVGARKLGASHYRLEAGEASFPLHAHLGTEEMTIVLEGAGTMRIGAERVPVAAGDVIAHVCDPALAHQLIAGPEGVRYLVVSTVCDPDVVLYPDSGKLLASGQRPPEGWPPQVRAVFRLDQQAPYWSGEAAPSDEDPG